MNVGRKENGWKARCGLGAEMACALAHASERLCRIVCNCPALYVLMRAGIVFQYPARIGKGVRFARPLVCLFAKW